MWEILYFSKYASPLHGHWRVEKALVKNTEGGEHLVH